MRKNKMWQEGKQSW